MVSLCGVSVHTLFATLAWQSVERGVHLPYHLLVCLLCSGSLWGCSALVLAASPMHSSLLLSPCTAPCSCPSEWILARALMKCSVCQICGKTNTKHVMSEWLGGGGGLHAWKSL